MVKHGWRLERSPDWSVDTRHFRLSRCIVSYLPPEAFEEKGRQSLVFPAAGVFTETGGQTWLEIGEKYRLEC